MARCAVVGVMIGLLGIGAAAQAADDRLLDELGEDQAVESGREMLDCVLGVPDLSGPGIDWALSVRVVPAFESEALLFLRKKGARVEGGITYPEGYRLADALAGSLSAGSKTVTCGEARRRLVVERLRTDGDKCGGLLRLARNFEAQHWPAVPNPGLVSDATLYEVRVQGFRDEARLVLQGSGHRGSAESGHPMIEWSKEAYRVLRSECTSARKSAGPEAKAVRE